MPAVPNQVGCAPRKPYSAEVSIQRTTRCQRDRLTSGRTTATSVKGRQLGRDFIAGRRTGAHHSPAAAQNWDICGHLPCRTSEISSVNNRRSGAAPPGRQSDYVAELIWTWPRTYGSRGASESYRQAWPAANWTAINSTSFCSPRIGRTMTVKLTSFPWSFQRSMSTPWT